MYNFDGILYRIWGVAGLFVLLGVCCILAPRLRVTTINKECVIAGLLCILFGVTTGIYYVSCYLHPSVQCIQSTLVEVRRNSRVAPPLPLTMEYIFLNNDGYVAFYLDNLAKKDVLFDDFELGHEYYIYYEEQTDIIVGVIKCEIP